MYARDSPVLGVLTYTLESVMVRFDSTEIDVTLISELVHTVGTVTLQMLPFRGALPIHPVIEPASGLRALVSPMLSEIKGSPLTLASIA